MAVNTVDSAGSQEWVKGDVVRFKQVLTNIVSNAVKFTHEGYIQVRYEVLTIHDQRADLIVEVVDTGIGIPDEAQAIVFENFSQADSSTTREYGGTGLGLALCRQLIELMGGTIGLRSEHGKGSTFWVKVPFVPPTNVPALPATPAQERLAIVVDSRVGSSSQLIAYLEYCGTTVHRALTMGECRQLSSGLRPNSVDFLFVDVQFIDSLHYVEQLRRIEAFASARIIVTGAPSDRRMVGEQSFLVKPYRLEQVVDFHRGHTRYQPNSDDSDKPYNGRRILVVEDNVINQQVARARLEKLGCEVEVAANGVEALHCLRDQTVDLVLMDCHMPEMDGYECTTRIREHSMEAVRRLPVIAMTANVMPTDREKCQQFAMSDFLGKPVTTEQLCEVLDRWIGRYHSEVKREPEVRQEAANTEEALV